MTLEAEWMKQQGGQTLAIPPPKRVSPFDKATRLVAFLVLLLIMAASVWALNLSPVAALLIPAFLIVFIAYLASRVHELGRNTRETRDALAELREELERLKSAGGPVSPSAPVSPSGGPGAAPQEPLGAERPLPPP